MTYAVFLHWSDRTLEANVAYRVRKAANAYVQTLADAVQVARAVQGLAGATIWEGDVLVAVWESADPESGVGVATYFHGRAP